MPVRAMQIHFFTSPPWLPSCEELGTWVWDAEGEGEGGYCPLILPPCFWSQMGPTKAIRSFQLVDLPKIQIGVCFISNSHV